jgi:hypothetical protein
MKSPRKKHTRTIHPPTPELVLNDEDREIAGVRNIAIAAKIVDKNGRPRIRVTKYRLLNAQIPAYKRGAYWYSTLRMLRAQPELYRPKPKKPAKQHEQAVA